MTRAERKRLAKAARELASNFAEGRGPNLDPETWCGCVAGQVARGSPVLSWELDNFVGGALTTATELHSYGLDPGAVVFPLLWLADTLEEM